MEKVDMRDGPRSQSPQIYVILGKIWQKFFLGLVVDYKLKKDHSFLHSSVYSIPFQSFVRLTEPGGVTRDTTMSPGNAAERS